MNAPTQVDPSGSDARRSDRPGVERHDAEPPARPADAVAAIDAAWDYGDPAASEARFRAQLPAVAARAAAGGDDDIAWRSAEVQLRTQLARSLGLQGRFDEAHAVLDGAAAWLDAADDTARVRCDLERGRVVNSAGDPEAARPSFAAAYDRARAAGLDALAVDAAHMFAIVAAPDEVMAWHERALALAEASPDPAARRWRASLLNNLGWTLHERGDDTAALAAFEQALALREAAGDPSSIHVARWCVGRILRALGRVDEALRIQQALAAESRATGRDDPHVTAEIAALTHPPTPPNPP